MSKEYVAPVAEVIAFDDVVLASISLSPDSDGGSYHAGSIINFSDANRS